MTAPIPVPLNVVESVADHHGVGVVVVDDRSYCYVGAAVTFVSEVAS